MIDKEKLDDAMRRHQSMTDMITLKVMLKTPLLSPPPDLKEKCGFKGMSDDEIREELKE